MAPTASDRIFRFAPSPNGELHLGHACSALINHDMATASSGRLLLRMEDTDTQRCRPEYEHQILDDLGWLGIVWDEPVRRQSDHLAVYLASLERLRKIDVVYPAVMSRRDIAVHVARAEVDGGTWPRDPDGAPIYPGTERNLGAAERQRLIDSGQPFAWRLDLHAAARRLGRPVDWFEEGRGPSGETGRIACDWSRWGDIVLTRSDRLVAYHLAVVVDDALQGVTDVVRGHDLFHATALHRLLQELLELPTPRYTHHHLLTDETGRKLSKRDRDLSLKSLRRRWTPADIRTMIEASPKI